jgi:myosin heavy subunit
MAIPSVVQGLIELEGKVFELDSSKGALWLESIGSFRYEPSGDSKPYTVRKEGSRGYWYGCRKIAGKVCKKYIGKSSEVSILKLEEIAEALGVPPMPRVNKVAEVAEVTEVTEEVKQVAEVTQDRLAVLELEVANLRRAVEALQEALPGKLEAGDSSELPKVDNKVAEELHNDLGNLKAENETLKADYAQLLKSSTVVANKLQEEVQKLLSQLETERTHREEVESKLTDLKQKSATASGLPEAAEILNQLKAKRKKSKTDLADLEVILEILES